MKIDKAKPYIVGIGGANVDTHVKLTVDPVLHDSNPCTVTTSLGGVARNIIDNLTRQGVATVMLTAVGNDANGRMVVEKCEEIGIDMSEVRVDPDFPTGTYTATIERFGEMFIAAADTRIAENIPLSYFDEKAEIIRGAAAIVCDPNLSKAQIVKIKEVAGDKKLFIDPVAKNRATKLKDILDRFYFLKPNRMELEELSDMPCNSEEEIVKAAQNLLSKGLESIAVSLSERGCYYADRSGNSIFRSLTESFEVANATGAGDAFMAGFINAYSRGLSIKDRLDTALSSGAIAVMSNETINPNMSKEYLDEFIKKYARKD